MSENRIAALEHVATMLVDARNELEKLKLQSPDLDELHGEISRAHGLCWQMIYDRMDRQRGAQDRRRRAAEA